MVGRHLKQGCDCTLSVISVTQISEVLLAHLLSSSL